MEQLKTTNNEIVKIEEVECDDYDDTQWKYFLTVIKGKYELWSDYFRKKPTLEEIKNIKDFIKIKEEQ